MSELDVLRLLIGAGFLFVASVLDLRTRRVPNGVWLALGGCALLLFLFEWFGTGRLDWVDALVALVVVLVAYLLWYLHIIAGGADAKALMALAILLPEPLSWSFASHTLPVWTSPMPAVVVVLANSVLAFVFVPLGFFVYNLVRGDASMPAMLLGYTMDLGKAAASFVWVVDHLDAEGRRRQVLFPSRVSEEQYEENLRRLRAAGVTRVWVTPKIPFMVPLLAGFVLAFFVGDILFHAVGSMMRLRGFG